MRSAVYGVSLLALTMSLPALADCAGDIAMVEQQLEAGAAPASDASAASPAKDEASAQAQSPEEVVDEMVEEGVEVEEDGQETKFASGGLAEPRESWHSGEKAPEEHPAVVHLTSAKEQLDQGNEQGCLDDVAKAKGELGEESE
jgi:hypothetical protein